MGTLTLKGKTEGLKVFEPLAAEEADAPATEAYREAFASSRRATRVRARPSRRWWDSTAKIPLRPST